MNKYVLVFIFIGLISIVFIKVITKEKRSMKKVYRRWKEVESTDDFKSSIMLNIVTGDVWNRFYQPKYHKDLPQDIVEIPVQLVVSQVQKETQDDLKESDVVNALCYWVRENSKKEVIKKHGRT